MQVSNHDRGAVKLLSTTEQSELTPSLETRLGNCHFSISLHPPISAACISPAHSKRDLPFLAQPSSNQFPVADMPAQVWIDSCGLSYRIFVTTRLGIRDTLGKRAKSREWNALKNTEHQNTVGHLNTWEAAYRAVYTAAHVLSRCMYRTEEVLIMKYTVLYL